MDGEIRAAIHAFHDHGLPRHVNAMAVGFLDDDGERVHFKNALFQTVSLPIFEWS